MKEIMRIVGVIAFILGTVAACFGIFGIIVGGNRDAYVCAAFGIASLLGGGIIVVHCEIATTLERIFNRLGETPYCLASPTERTRSDK